MAYNVGLVGPYDYDGVVQSDFFAAMVLFYANRTPLVTRLPNKPVSGLKITAVDDAFRPNSTTLTDANGVTNSVTTFTVTSGTADQILPGDVIQVDSELVLVTAVNTTANTLTVVRGHASSTAAAHNTNSTVYLIGNTRTGAEVDQDASQRVFDAATTYPQTVQHPYQIGGSSEATSSNMAIPGGFASLVGYQRAKTAQEVLDDFERSMYYGKANALAADTTRPMMQGLVNRLSTCKVTSPTNSSAYKPSDFERDFITAPYNQGGKPDVCVLSFEYRTAFQIWGLNMVQLLAGDTSIGLDITTFQSPSLGGINIIFSPLLRPYTGFSLTSEEVYMGWKREPFDKPRGSRGDAIEGDVIGEGCLIVNNEGHHAWVSGVTAFAKQS